MALLLYKRLLVLRLLPNIIRPVFLSPTKILVGLGRNSLAVIMQSRGLQKRMIDQKYALVSAANDTQTWQHATKELDSLLATMQVKPNDEMHIVLASNLTRYLTLPTQQILMNSAEKLAYSIAAYREVYGSVVDEWKIKLDDAPPHQATIAAAIDKNLLAAFSQISLKYQLKLIAISPYLMTAFNFLASQIGKSSGYLVIVESERFLLISLHNGQCENVRAFAVDVDWQIELNRLLLREALLQENNYRDVLVYAPAQKNIVLNEVKGWKVKPIHSVCINQRQNNIFTSKPVSKKIIEDPHFSILEASI